MVQGLIHDIPSCQELVTRMVSEAEAIIKTRLNRMAGISAAQAAE
jgi:nitronate monooxygenase